MKNRFLPALLLIAAMTAGLIFGIPRAGASTYDDRIAEAQKKQKELEAMLEEAKKRKAEFEQKQKDAEAYLAELSGDIEKITAYIREVDEQLQDIYDRISDLDFRISEKEEELVKTKQELADAIERQQEQYEVMKKRIRYTYENGSESILELLAGSRSIADFLNRVEYRSSIAQYDKTLYERYQAATKVVVATKEYLEASIENLEEMKAEAEAERESAEELAAKKGEQLEEYMALYQMEDELLFNYISEIDSGTASIEDLYRQWEEAEKAEETARAEKEAEARRIAEEERKKREAEAAALAAQRKAEEEAARQKALAELEKQRLTAADGIVMTTETNLYKMIWPLPGDGRTFSGFGPRKAPLPGASTFHNGVDIGGVQGAKVVAVLAGKVTYAQYNSSGGNTVMIDHGNGVSTRYCHASKLLVKAGDYVLQGQPIMLVGSTGISTGPHLHFAVLINGSYVDPMKYIKYTE